MFKAVLTLIFPSMQGEKKPNYFYFEEDQNVDGDVEQQTIANLQNSAEIRPLRLASVEGEHQQDFYDYLFGQSPPTTQHDELSNYVANKVEALLKQPHYILDVMPILPASLTMIIEQLSDDDFNIEDLLKLIEQEPSIAAKVIELANSTFYNRSQKEITDLKSAFMLLGRDGLVEGVINGFVSKLTPQSKTYFKQYGNKIWQHSLSSGVIAKALINASAYKNEAAQGYLIGLICNLGDMIIYQLLMEAFAFVHPDCQPNSYAYKELMQKKSKQLTYQIAKHWQFPQSILDALALQVKLIQSSMLASVFSKRPIACYVYEASIISELMMMFDHKDKTEDEIKGAMTTLLYSDEAKQYIESLFTKQTSDL